MLRALLAGLFLAAVTFAVADEAADVRRTAVERIAALIEAADKAVDDNPDDDKDPAEAFLDQARAGTEAFAIAHAPAGGVLVIASGKLVLVVGGPGAKDGATVVVLRAPADRHVALRGGDGGPGGKAGLAAAWTGGIMSTGANGGGTGGGRGGGFSMRMGKGSICGTTGRNGEDAEPGDDDIGPRDRMAGLATAVDALAAGWGDDDKRAAGVAELGKFRPTCGAFAAYSTDGKLLVVIGADGGDRNQDGLAVEVDGPAAERIVVIAGNAGAGGKPGTAKGPEGAVRVDGK